MTDYLLDANVAIALVVPEYEHHTRAAEWFGGIERALGALPQQTLLLPTV